METLDYYNQCGYLQGSIPTQASLFQSRLEILSVKVYQKGHHLSGYNPNGLLVSTILPVHLGVKLKASLMSPFHVLQLGNFLTFLFS